jgi:hypothetical protein
MFSESISYCITTIAISHVLSREAATAPSHIFVMRRRGDSVGDDMASITLMDCFGAV